MREGDEACDPSMFHAAGIARPGTRTRAGSSIASMLSTPQRYASASAVSPSVSYYGPRAPVGR
ncbi:MAG: hypothetical protein D8B55_00820 [Actinomyces sp.]|nr:MAG: hypothetical protein D8B55_00820 [Actinomyces sp.]